MQLTNKTTSSLPAHLSGIGHAPLLPNLPNAALTLLVLGARQYVTLCEITQSLEQQYQIKAIAVQCDVTVEEDCSHLIKQTLVTFGKIDVLVNNAGISMRALFNDAEIDVLKKVTWM